VRSGEGRGGSRGWARGTLALGGRERKPVQSLGGGCSPRLTNEGVCWGGVGNGGGAGGSDTSQARKRGRGEWWKDPDFEEGTEE